MFLLRPTAFCKCFTRRRSRLVFIWIAQATKVLNSKRVFWLCRQPCLTISYFNTCFTIIVFPDAQTHIDFEFPRCTCASPAIKCF